MKPKLAVVGQHREVSEETVRALSYLLREAKAGNVTGMAFVAFNGGYQFSTGIVGKSRDIPTLTRGMIRQLDDEAAELYVAPPFG